jgi:hypothetical protein
VYWAVFSVIIALVASAVTGTSLTWARVLAVAVIVGVVLSVERLLTRTSRE